MKFTTKALSVSAFALAMFAPILASNAPGSNFPVGYDILANEVNIGVTSIILRDGSGAPVWRNWGVEL